MNFKVEFRNKNALVLSYQVLGILFLERREVLINWCFVVVPIIWLLSALLLSDLHFDEEGQKMKRCSVGQRSKLKMNDSIINFSKNLFKLVMIDKNSLSILPLKSDFFL